MEKRIRLVFGLLLLFFGLLIHFEFTSIPEDTGKWLAIGGLLILLFAVFNRRIPY